MTPFLSPLATDQGFVFLLFQRAGRAYKQAGNLRRITVRKKDKTIGGNRTRVLPNANGGGWELRAKHLFISHQRDRERGGMGTCRTAPPPLQATNSARMQGNTAERNVFGSASRGRAFQHRTCARCRLTCRFTMYHQGLHVIRRNAGVVCMRVQS